MKEVDIDTLGILWYVVRKQTLCWALKDKLAEGRKVAVVSRLERGGWKSATRHGKFRGKLGTVRVLPIITDLDSSVFREEESESLGTSGRVMTCTVRSCIQHLTEVAAEAFTMSSCTEGWDLAFTLSSPPPWASHIFWHFSVNLISLPFLCFPLELLKNDLIS